MKLKTALSGLAALTVLTFAGWGVNKMITYKPLMEKPKKAHLLEQQGVVNHYNSGGELYVKDLDGDGIVDAIHFAGSVHFIADGYQDEVSQYGFYHINEDTLPLTPELRQLATKAMNLDRQVALEMANAKYDAQQQKLADELAEEESTPTSWVIRGTNGECSETHQVEIAPAYFIDLKLVEPLDIEGFNYCRYSEKKEE